MPDQTEDTYTDDYVEADDLRGKLDEALAAIKRVRELTGLDGVKDPNRRIERLVRQDPNTGLVESIAVVRVSDVRAALEGTDG